jgi:D-alanyl-D-alanine carboxypeptidase
LDTLRRQRNVDLLLHVQDVACGQTFVHVGPTTDAHAGSLVRVGSISKTLVAALILKLAAEGRFTLDDPLRQHLRDMPAVFGGVTVRQALQHTSGIYNYTDSPAWQRAIEATPRRTWQPSELLAFAAAEPLAFEPGTRWSYSNSNYVLLGMLAEQVGRQPLAALLRAHVLAPHQLNQTFLDGAETPSAPLLPGLDKRGVDITERFHPSFAWAAGAVVSSPADTTRFMALVGSRAVVPVAYRDDFERSIAAGSGVAYGLGVFFVDERATGGAGKAIGHGGDIFGYHSWSMHFESKNTTVTAVSASDAVSGNDILVAALPALFE